MARANFDACLRLTLQYEGGYVDHPADPGGATNLGITRRTLARYRGRAVTKQEVRALSRAEAAEIYRKYYWDAVHGDDMPAGVDAALFDHAVNSGPSAAVHILQKALGLRADGKLGPITRAAACAAEPAHLIRQLLARRKSFLTRLRTFRTFGRGWMRRVKAIEAASLAMVASAIRETELS